MRAFSLITSRLGPSPVATRSPWTSPSTRRPSEKRSSPCTAVPSPIRLRMGGCFLLLNHMCCCSRRIPNDGAAGLGSRARGLRGQHHAAGIEHPHLRGFYHGPRGVVDLALEAQVLAQLETARPAGHGQGPGLAVERALQRDLVAALAGGATLRANHQNLVAGAPRLHGGHLEGPHLRAVAGLARGRQQALEE